MQPTDTQLLIENISVFEKLGFEIEEFGANTFAVRRVPSAIEASQTESTIFEITELLKKSKDEIIMISKYLRKEGSTYIVPNIEDKNFIGWYNTSDNKIYSPGDRVVVTHGLHFLAIYETNKESDDIRFIEQFDRKDDE